MSRSAEAKVPLTLRLPVELRGRLQELAETERRSVQGQILFLVERALAAQHSGGVRPD